MSAPSDTRSDRMACDALHVPVSDEQQVSAEQEAAGSAEEGAVAQILMGLTRAAAETPNPCVRMRRICRCRRRGECTRACSTSPREAQSPLRSIGALHSRRTLTTWVFLHLRALNSTRTLPCRVRILLQTRVNGYRSRASKLRPIGSSRGATTPTNRHVHHCRQHVVPSTRSSSRVSLCASNATPHTSRISVRYILQSCLFCSELHTARGVQHRECAQTGGSHESSTSYLENALIPHACSTSVIELMRRLFLDLYLYVTICSSGRVVAAARVTLAATASM